ncbi:MAG: hypothetical protein QGI09_04825, partial [Dehalococcoidia bacterium]|nr:hypothetical protein [Dehalococcoidia bacterium]
MVLPLTRIGVGVDMTLAGLFPLLSQSTQHQGLLELLKPGQAMGQAVLLDSALPYWLGALRPALNIPITVLVPRHDRARRVYEDLLVWCGNHAEVYQLPEGETLPLERLMADDATTHGRICALAALLNLDEDRHQIPPIVIASVAALSQKTLSKEVFQAACHYVSVGQRINLGNVLERWQAMGYRAGPVVEVPGMVSRRGGILDIYSPGAQFPARIELVGDLVESIRLFDPTSQRSLRMVERVSILPPQEVLPGLASVEEVQEQY